MQIRFHLDTGTTVVQWEFVIHNKSHLWDIDTTSKNISCNEHARDTSSKLIHDLVAGDRVHPFCACQLCTTDERGCEASIAHPLRKLESLSSLVHKDNALADVHGPIEPRKLVELIPLIVAPHVHLGNAGDSELSFLHLNRESPRHQFFSKLPYIIWICGAEKQHLDLRRHEAPNLCDLWPHLVLLVKHHIGLIEYEDLDVGHIKDVLLGQILDLARCSNEHVGLRMARYPLLRWNHQSSNDGQVMPKLRDYSLVLSRQFPGGADDQCLRSLLRWIECTQQGQREGRSFARAILCLANHVLRAATLADERQRCCLDLRRLHEARLIDASEQLLRQA
mmetsp:Transcript_156956/g.273239  ORF Transcript_156956/g.273239 Transcript_156956/m.273239 type:complete len:336 (-) Transcript_156956:356-1363(-)